MGTIAPILPSMRWNVVLAWLTVASIQAADLDQASLVWFITSDPLEEVVEQWCQPSESVVTIDGRTYRVDIDGIHWDGTGTPWQPLNAVTTAYTPTRDECDEDPDRTAIGAMAFETYGIAADPRAIAYRSVVRVPGYGDAMIDDTGSAMRRSWSQGVLQLDLRIPFRAHDGRWRSESECKRIARNHGVQEDVVLLRLDRPRH